MNTTEENKKTDEAEGSNSKQIIDALSGVTETQIPRKIIDRQLEPIIIGAGGFAREVRAEVNFQYGNTLKMYVDDEYWQEGLYKISEFNPQTQSALIAVGNPADKKKLVAKLPEETKYWNYISPRAYVLNAKIGVGNFICAGTIVTVNVEIGNHVHLNLHTTVGHDAIIGDFVTTAPNVNISGNVTIKEGVYLGTASCVREKITICEDVILGMNASVVKDIVESGTYVGIPVKKIK